MHKLISTLKYLTICVSLLGLESTYAKQVDLRHLQTPVKNQDDRDTCAYFAITALIESTIKNFNGVSYDISEEFEIFRHKVLAPWRPEVEFGSTYELLKNFSNGFNFYTESSLPYRKSSPDFTQALSPELFAQYNLDAKKGPSVHYRSLKAKTLTQLWIKTPWSQQIMDELNQNRSVVVTLKLSLPHINDQTGVIQYDASIDQACQTAKSSCGGHAVLIVGYDDIQRQFIIKNSWGPQWGDQGYGYVTFAHIDAFSDHPLTAYFDKYIDPWVQPRP